jgi:acetyl/propionyl-CoA carboxylase alpha subunit
VIRKLLVANRGEIAVRILRAAREMGVRTVAVYSEADRSSLHARLADEAFEIGPSEPSASYLDLERVIVAAKASGADAIHPGYGFLSERAEFAERCEAEGIRFVGPPAFAMRALGAKIDAKTLAVRIGVPVTPGFFEEAATADLLEAAAAEIGYPVMLKASAGGGGRGMRIVSHPAAFREELAIASDEALKAFGDGAMMVEKLVSRPRHIEVQILADSHGNVATLFERECSVQRRHQKLIEESPAPTLDRMAGLWDRMRESARSLALEAGYVGAGTVEFMVDEAAGEFYFLEVNARLQVEHPVTEFVTGLDLVQWQIRIAGGERLDLGADLMQGSRTALRGHAIEARVVAEDPSRGFLPSSGRIVGWAMPEGPGIRVDTGYFEGAEIPRYYDSLIGKVIVHAENRDQAIARLTGALRECHVLGVRTNIEYLLDILGHSQFVAGQYDTGFLGREFAEWQPSTDLPAGLGAIVDHARSGSTAGSNPDAQSGSADHAASGAWGTDDGFRVVRS